MVLNSNLVMAVAHLSANLCEYIACNPERLGGEAVLNLLFCVPLRHFGRLALSFWTYLCYNPNPHHYYLSSSSSSSDSDSESGSDDYQDSHSD